MIKAMIESVARITTVRGKHSGKFRRVACTLHVALSKPQHEAATCRGASQGFRNSIEKVHRKDRRTEGQTDRRTEGQKDRRTEGPIDKQSRCTTRTGGRKDIRTEGRKHRRTEAQIDRSTDRQTDTPTNGHTENNPRNGQPENRTSGPTTRAMPRGAELPCPRSRRPPSHCPAAVHELSRLPW